MNARKQTHTQKEARRPTILVVEDEVLVRSAIAEELRDSGFTVIEAASAAEATAVFEAGERIDVVFSDVQMTGAMDGVGLRRWVNQHYPGVPVVLTSGKSAPGGGASGASDFFVMKPYKSAEVCDRIRNLIDAKERNEDSS